MEIKETPATFCRQNGINEGWDPFYPGIFYASAIKEFFFCLEGWNLFYLGKKAELRKFRDSFSFFRSLLEPLDNILATATYKAPLAASQVFLLHSTPLTHSSSYPPSPNFPPLFNNNLHKNYHKESCTKQKKYLSDIELECSFRSWGVWPPESESWMLFKFWWGKVIY